MQNTYSKTPSIAPTAVVHPKSIIIGNVTIDEGSIVFPGAVIHAKDEQVIKIGRNVLVEDNCVIEPEVSLDIKDNVIIGHGAIIMGRAIGKNSLIGINAVVGPGVTTGEITIISSGCVVDADTSIPDRTIVSGAPSKIKGQLQGPDPIWVSADQKIRAMLYKLITDTFNQPPVFKCHETAQVHPCACIIGDVTIGKDTIVGPGAVLRGDFSPIRIGENCILEENCVLHAGDPHEQLKGRLSPLEIGDKTIIGAGAVVNGRQIEDRVNIGPNASILHGVRIGMQSRVAPFSVVKALKIPKNSSVSGLPGQITPGTGQSCKDTSTPRPQDAYGYLTCHRSCKPVLKGPASIHPSAKIYGQVEIGKGAVIGAGTILNGSISPLKLGEDTDIGSHTILVSMPRLSGKGCGLLIEGRTHIGPGAVIRGREIGPGSRIGAKTYLPKEKELPGGSITAPGTQAD